MHQLHLELTGQLLRKTLVRRDYNRAFKLYSTLTTTLKVSEELVWKIGCEFLMHRQEYEPLCLRFLQLIFAKAKFCKASILIETALYQLRFGKLEDAHITLEPYINIYPYNENPLLLGYAGVVEFALWIKTIRAKYSNELKNNQAIDIDQDFDIDDKAVTHDDWLEDEENESNDARQWTSRISRHGNAAANLLEQALEKNSKNDMFLTYLVRLRCGNVGMGGLGSKSISRKRKLAIHEMKGYLKRFYTNNNDSILSLQLLAALENREKQQTLELILNQDPAANSELYVRPLLRILQQNIPAAQQEIISNIENSQHPNVDATNSGKWSRSRELDHRAMPHWIHEHGDKPRSSANWSKRSIPYSRNDQQDTITRQEKPLSSTQEVTVQSLARHEPNIKYLRPILMILLMRAEFGTITVWEEQELVRICGLFCFCSLYCRHGRHIQET
ncbi:hypothetical protein BGX26_006956 [Mortierella sp. AD094]|nr:hypothetical protein BGX26_006956 [Mortierella sp. AD094]